MRKIPDIEELTELVLNLIEERRPKSVKQLAGMIKEEVSLGETEIIDMLLTLQAKDVISFQDTPHSVSPIVYLKSYRVLWFWIIISIEIITLGSVFLLPTVYPFVLIRNVFGVIFILGLPGYVLIRFIFPINKSGSKSELEIERLQRGVLSLGASFALVSIIGLLLYYAGGLDLVIITLSLSLVTLLFATATLIREYK